MPKTNEATAKTKLLSESTINFIYSMNNFKQYHFFSPPPKKHILSGVSNLKITGNAIKGFR